MTLREPSEIEAAKQARRIIGLVRRKLLNPTPQVLESCAPHLRTAIQSMEHLQKLIGGPATLATVAARGDLRAEVRELGRELAQINALMRGAAQYYSGLATFLLPPAEELVSYSSTAGARAAASAPTMVLEG
jgi:hypothetical protein